MIINSSFADSVLTFYFSAQSLRRLLAATTLCMAGVLLSLIAAHRRSLVGVVVALAAAAFAYYKFTQVSW